MNPWLELAITAVAWGAIGFVGAIVVDRLTRGSD